MKVLIAEDSRVARTLLTRTLTDLGFEVVVTCDGEQAWQELQKPEAPRLVILDWMMPGLDGIDVCRKVRGVPTTEPPFVILLTGRDEKADVVAGLEAGANDYIVKPFDPAELRARVHVGRRVIELQAALHDQIRNLENALAQVKQLQGLLPICCYCKKIRDNQNYWHQVEIYLRDHAEVHFSHGMCPDCLDKEMKRLHAYLQESHSAESPPTK